LKIAVLGASGLLGSALVPKLKAFGQAATSLGRSPSCDYICNVGDLQSIERALNELLPDIIINLVALKDVDLCEKNPNHAYMVNVKTLENVVSWIETACKSCHLIQLSTDQVYDQAGPHLEDDVTLTNYYSFSKYAAELLALRIPSTILRTNFFGKSNCDERVSFTDWLYNNIINKTDIFLFNDVYFSPLSMKTLCDILSRLVSLKPLGIYNLGSRDGFSKAEFAFSFANKIKLNIYNATVTSIEDVNFMDTYRPKDMRLNVSKIEGELGIALPTLNDEIGKVIGDYCE